MAIVDDDVDIDEMVGLVAAKHGITIDRRDPVAIIPTLVQLGITRGVREALASQGEGRAELRAFVEETRAAVARVFEAEVRAVFDRVRAEVQVDLDRASARAATLVADVNHAHSRPIRAYWTTLGLLSGFILLATGFLGGMYLGR